MMNLYLDFRRTGKTTKLINQAPSKMVFSTKSSPQNILFYTANEAMKERVKDSFIRETIPHHVTKILSLHISKDTLTDYISGSNIKFECVNGRTEIPSNLTSILLDEYDYFEVSFLEKLYKYSKENPSTNIIGYSSSPKLDEAFQDYYKFKPGKVAIVHEHWNTNSPKVTLSKPLDNCLWKVQWFENSSLNEDVVPERFLELV